MKQRSKFSMQTIILIIIGLHLFPSLVFAKYPKIKTFDTTIGEINISIQPKPQNYTGSGKREWKSFDSSGKPICKDLYRMTFGDNLLYLLDDELIVNQYSYGEISKDDKVEIIDKDVYINNKVAKGELLSNEFRVSLSSPDYFSSTKLGGHSIFVAPGSSITSETKEFNGFYTYRYEVGNTIVSICRDTLTVNGRCIGLLSENSTIIIEEGNVYVNNEAKMQELNISLDTD
ncbi:MAG: hypothetical protein JXR56_04465 [Candidatus Cloacimonetes bacterium]|nr:hypothetical protein [Candidatus Cloacimonadota bacterium]